MQEGIRILGKVLKISAGLVILFAVIYGGYGDLDRDGWIAHTQAVEVFMAPDWLVGENRICNGVQTPSNANPPRELNSLFCPQDTTSPSPHNITIKFWGRTSRDNSKTDDSVWGASFHWRCTRNTDSFVCKAID
jgi:hypothetical protein